MVLPTRFGVAVVTGRPVVALHRNCDDSRRNFDSKHCLRAQANHPASPSRRRLGCYLPENRSTFISIRTCCTRDHAGCDSSWTGSNLVRDVTIHLGAPSDPRQSSNGRALSFGRSYWGSNWIWLGSSDTSDTALSAGVWMTKYHCGYGKSGNIVNINTYSVFYLPYLLDRTFSKGIYGLLLPPCNL